MLEELRSGIARVLLGVTEAPERPVSLEKQVSRLSMRCEEFETQLQQQGLRVKNLVSEVEDMLERATNRYAAARGAETRAKKKLDEDEDVETNGAPDIVNDPDGYRRWLNTR